MSPTLYNCLLKQADEEEKPKPKRVPPRRKKRLIAEPFPDYGRSLVSQERGNPVVSGLIRALKYGLTSGAIASAGTAYASPDEDKARNALIAGIIGSLATGVPAYISGKKEQESNNSRLLFLRRLGIDSPGELEAMNKYSPLTGRLAERGHRI